MNIDVNKIDEVVLALLHVTSVKEGEVKRSWESCFISTLQDIELVFLKWPLFIGLSILLICCKETPSNIPIAKEIKSDTTLQFPLIHCSSVQNLMLQ